MPHFIFHRRGRRSVARMAAWSLIALLAACARTPLPPATLQWLCMGTTAAVSAPHGEEARLQRIRAAAGETFAEIERDLSVFRPASTLAAINAAAGSGIPVTLGAHAAAVIALARDAAAAGGGAFDPTVGPLMALWGFRGTTRTQPPDEAEIAAARARVDWRAIRLDTLPDGTSAASLACTDMALDLGGIAKGYAVDCAFDRLRATQETDFLINLGGNIRACGTPGAGRDGWRIGVRDPFRRDGLLGTVTLADGEAVATSGNYERFVELAGTRYAHIIDPRSGRPVRGMAGVTVLAPTAAAADALSTTLFVLGAEEGRRLLERTPGCHALWVTDETPPRLIPSPGFAARFAPEQIRK